MKKLFFSAVFLMAFSSVSVGNTISDENEVIKGDLKKSTKHLTEINQNTIVVVKTDCMLAKFTAYNDARAAGFSVQEATGISYSIYFTCMGLSLQP